MKTQETITGATYVITATEDGTIETPDGVTICSFTAGAQCSFIAPCDEVECSDDDAIITRPFKAAPLGSSSSGGGDSSAATGWDAGAYEALIYQTRALQGAWPVGPYGTVGLTPGALNVFNGFSTGESSMYMLNFNGYANAGSAAFTGDYLLSADFLIPVSTLDMTLTFASNGMYTKTLDSSTGVYTLEAGKSYVFHVFVTDYTSIDVQTIKYIKLIAVI